MLASARARDTELKTQRLRITSSSLLSLSLSPGDFLAHCLSGRSSGGPRELPPPALRHFHDAQSPARGGSREKETKIFGFFLPCGIMSRFVAHTHTYILWTKA